MIGPLPHCDYFLKKTITRGKGLLNWIRDFIKKIKEAYHFSNEWAKKSYSQEGEDIVLNRLLDETPDGFYVEVGAHHPFRFSNTNFFYRKGWKGICIDPVPGVKELFNKYRPRDIALQIGVSNTPSVLKYFIFNEPALNTFDLGVAKERNGLRQYKVIEEKNVPTDTLSNILDKYLPQNQSITILSVDVEGMDLEVLKSNDWSRYRPKFIVAECLTANIFDLQNDLVVAYITSLGYVPFAVTGYSILFKSKELAQDD